MQTASLCGVKAKAELPIDLIGDFYIQSLMSKTHCMYKR